MGYRSSLYDWALVARLCPGVQLSVTALRRCAEREAHLQLLACQASQRMNLESCVYIPQEDVTLTPQRLGSGGQGQVSLLRLPAKSLAHSLLSGVELLV